MEGAAGHWDILLDCSSGSLPFFEGTTLSHDSCSFCMTIFQCCLQACKGVCVELPGQACTVMVSEVWLVLGKYLRLKEAHQNPLMLCHICRVHLAISYQEAGNLATCWIQTETRLPV